MKAALAMPVVLTAFAMLAFAPAGLYAQTTQDQQSQQHHPQSAPSAPAQAASQTPLDLTAMMARMNAADEKLEVLVKKMNETTGTARVDVMTKLLSEMVEDRQNMHQMMTAGMMSLSMIMKHMEMMREHHGAPETGPASPRD